MSENQNQYSNSRFPQEKINAQELKLSFENENIIIDINFEDINGEKIYNDKYRVDSFSGIIFFSLKNQ